MTGGFEVFRLSKSRTFLTYVLSEQIIIDMRLVAYEQSSVEPSCVESSLSLTEVVDMSLLGNCYRLKFD